MFPEQISLENEDLVSFRIAGVRGLPPGLDNLNTFQFRGMPSAEKMEQYRRDAAHAAAALTVPPGAPAGVVGPAPPAPAGQQAPAGAVVVAADEEVWVRIETDGAHLRGSEVTLDGGEVLRGDIGLKTVEGRTFAIRRMPKDQVSDFKGKEASADARLLGLNFQGLNRAHGIAWFIT